MPLTGVTPLAPQLDTSGFLCRESTIWAAAAKVLYPELVFYDQYPKTIQTIGFDHFALLEVIRPPVRSYGIADESPVVFHYSMLLRFRKSGGLISSVVKELFIWIGMGLFYSP